MALLLNKKTLAIDFGSHGIKIVEAKYTKNSLNISKSFKIKLPKHVYSDGDILDKDIIVKHIKEALEENQIKTKTTNVVINSSYIVTREVTIPKVPENEISSIISFQLEEFLPVASDEFVINNLVLGSVIEDEIEKIRILIIAIPKNMVLSHLDLIKKTGLKAQILDFQGNAMAKLLDFGEFINGDYNTRDITIAVVDIGYTSSKLSIVKNGNIEVSRVINTGSDDLYKNLSSFFDYSQEELEGKLINIKDINKEDEDYTDEARLVNLTKTTMTNIMEKIEAIFRFYTSREGSNEINLLVLQGGLANIKGIDNLFSNYFNIPSLKLDKLERVSGNKDLKTYSNAIGALIRIDEVKK